MSTFEACHPVHWMNDPKTGRLVETRTPIAGFVDQYLVLLDDKPKINDANTSKE